MNKFDSIFIVKKIDDAASNKVADVVDTISFVAKSLNLVIKGSWKEVNDRTLTIAVGGDGTMLYAMKNAVSRHSPVIGYNLGKVGFLTEFGKDEVYESLILAQQDQLQEEFRTILNVRTSNESFNVDAVNEVVITRLYSGSIFRYDLHIGNCSAGSHMADAVMVATPTGSTAYALSAGGALIDTHLDVLEIIPVAALTMTSRPIITSAAHVIKINAVSDENNPVVIRADGQTVATLENRLVEIKISGFDKKVKLLHHSKWNFFDTLTAKLGWNK